MYSINKSKAFTLVELIVVIVILAILATIAFLSFSSQSASARDSTRLSDMNNIAKGLSVFNATSGSYPKPDSNIAITASGNVIGYQGKAGGSVLNMIKISNGGKDPLDNTAYYTYSTNAGQSRFQILGFLEDGSSSALSFIPISFAADYSKRFTITKGDNIGVLLGSGTLDPIENQLTVAFTGVDLVNTIDSYSMKFDNNSSISGTGIILRAGIAGGGLVGYWDFNEGSGATAHDKSGNGNDGIFSGIILPSWTNNGKIGGGLNFLTNSGVSGVNGAYVEFGQLKKMFATSAGTPHTIAGWVYIPNMLCNDDNACRQWVMLLGTPGTGSHHWLLGGLHGPTQFGIWSGKQLNFQYEVGKWSFISMIFDGRNLYGFVDGKKYSLDNTITSSDIIDLKDSSFVIGGKYGEASYNGLIDEVRIYNRALSDLEIQTLYNSTK